MAQRCAMRTFLRVVVSFVAGLIAIYVVAVAIGLGYMTAFDVFDRDGGLSMAVMFGIGPLAAIVGGIAAAIIVPVWLGRRDLARAESRTPQPQKRWPPNVRAAVAAVCWGVATYLAMRLLFWLFIAGMSFRSYWVALAVGLSPLLLGLFAAALAACLVLRNARATA
jgi:hypothetical protein